MTTSTTEAPASASALLAMHARFETAWAEYNRIDNAGLQSKDNMLSHKLETAMQENAAETSALRVAILYQVPDTWVEALILMFHIDAAHDARCNDHEPDKAEGKALTVAIETLFDFMAHEVRCDHEKIGHQLAQSAVFAYERRARRTGVLEAMGEA